ncbi:hypothetical protein BC567DRAFT_236776 [Phyllosticta citribraziliensis]
MEQQNVSASQPPIKLSLWRPRGVDKGQLVHLGWTRPVGSWAGPRNGDFATPQGGMGPMRDGSIKEDEGRACGALARSG